MAYDRGSHPGALIKSTPSPGFSSSIPLPFRDKGHCGPSTHNLQIHLLYKSTSPLLQPIAINNHNITIPPTYTAMTPVGFMGPIFATSTIFASNSSTSGVPFGNALLIALGATTGLVVVPFILYAVISSLIRCCKERRARRQNARRHPSTRTSTSTSARLCGAQSWPGCACAGCNGSVACAAKKTKNQKNSNEQGNRGANAVWPKPSPPDTIEGIPIGTEENWQTETITGPTLPYIWKTTKYNGPVEPPSSIRFPWTKTTWSNSNNNRDCEKGAVRGEKTVEERKENIVAALVGFLRSWARVEGDGRS